MIHFILKLIIHLRNMLPFFRMQDIYKKNSDFVVNELKKCVSKEQERNPIIVK